MSNSEEMVYLSGHVKLTFSKKRSSGEKILSYVNLAIPFN